MLVSAHINQICFMSSRLTMWGPETLTAASSFHWSPSLQTVWSLSSVETPPPPPSWPITLTAPPTAATPLSQSAASWDRRTSPLAREKMVQSSGANRETGWEQALGWGLGWGRWIINPYSRKKLDQTSCNQIELERSTRTTIQQSWIKLV